MPEKDFNFSSGNTQHPIALKLIDWYSQQKRALPWRDHPVPYAVWVGEIMAQQTRLDSMLPYYERWMILFPNVNRLAQAKLQDVLKAWEGLGYYQRARNMHKAAKMFVREYQGEIPNSVDQLLKIPGIGPYTAGAIASIAFQKDEAAVDGNAARVFARLFNIKEPINQSKGLKEAWQRARSILPQNKASDFNQALMDLGANVCLPRLPKCDQCPLNIECEAHQLGLENELPNRKKIKNIPTKIYAAWIIKSRGSVLVRQRSPDGLLGGLWEFPNIEIETAKKAKTAIQKDAKALDLSISELESILEIDHQYSHFKAKVFAYSSVLKGERINVNQPYRWVLLSGLDALAMGKIDRTIADNIVSVVGLSDEQLS